MSSLPRLLCWQVYSFGNPRGLRCMHYCSAIRVEWGLLLWMRYYVVCVGKWCINSFFGVIFHLSTRAFRESCLRVAPCTTSLLAPWFFCVNIYVSMICVRVRIYSVRTFSHTKLSTFKLFVCLHVRVWWGKWGVKASTLNVVFCPKSSKKWWKYHKWTHARTHTPGEVREATHVAGRRSWQNNFDEQAKIFRPNVSHLLCFWCLLSFTLSLPFHSSSLFMKYNARICCSVILCNVQVRVGSECTEARAKRG